MTHTLDRIARLILGMALGASAASTACAQERESFGEWVADCDNVRSCVAVDLAEDGADVIAYLKVTRSGEPGAGKHHLFRHGEHAGRRARLGAVGLAFDDPAIPGLPAARLGAERDDDYSWGARRPTGRRFPGRRRAPRDAQGDDPHARTDRRQD